MLCGWPECELHNAQAHYRLFYLYFFGFIFKVPIIIPYVVLIISVYLVIGPIIDNPQIEYLYALSFIFTGLIFYVPFVKFGMTPRFMSECF